jgi:hypothetical protein
MNYKQIVVNNLLSTQASTRHTENYQKPVELHRINLIITLGDVLRF